ncbi:hypothetical protein HHI36_005135 [Cryptolaemus montrouzieri]|uniref:Uncharacterized protein n=1 Tax=Cryptolaemus montrouzieri TaxID=559131 RepID=A0ABD2NT75_9CUCU
MKDRDVKYARWKKIQNDYTKSEFIKARNSVNNKEKSEEAICRQQTLDFGGPKGISKKIWAVLNKLCRFTPKKQQNGETISQAEEICTVLNTHFSNVGYQMASVIKQLRQTEFLEEEKRKHSLRINKSTRT